MLEIRGLNIDYYTAHGALRATHDVEFTVGDGRAVALVGESGSGKSSVALGTMRLIRPPIGDVADGEVRLNGRNLLDIGERDMRSVLRTEIGYVPQDPTTALDPLCTVGRHITETLVDGTRADKRRLAEDMLRRLGVEDAAHRLDAYPHQFSGGMQQRVAIATALAKSPSILIADEPTTALDVTTQFGILQILRDEQHRRQLSMLFVTHDLSVARAVCDDVVVMYAGRVVESGPIVSVMEHPRHPYTKALIACSPSLLEERVRLNPIPGQPPALSERIDGCPFAPRCPEADRTCTEASPPTETIEDATVACWKVNTLV